MADLEEVMEGVHFFDRISDVGEAFEPLQRLIDEKRAKVILPPPLWEAGHCFCSSRSDANYSASWFFRLRG
jgi:hypothetical protein